MKDEEKTKDELVNEVKMLRWLLENAKGRQEDLVKSEESLRDHERTLEACFNSNPESIMVANPEGIVLTANESAAARLGMAAHEVSGMTFADLFPRDVADGRIGRIEEAVFTQRPVRFDDVCRDRYFDNCVYPVVDDRGLVSKLVMVSSDTTERRNLEAALEEAEWKYRRTYEVVGEGIFRTAPDGHFISVNNALARMLGYASPEDLIRSVKDIARQHYVDPNRRGEFLKVLNEDGVVYNFEARLFRKDKTTIWVSINARAVRDRTGILYYEGAIEDITRQKRLEAQLVQSQKTETVGRLAGGLAHNFNNILTVIMGNLELLLQRPELRHFEDTREAKAIRDSVGQALRLCDQLLGLGKKQFMKPVETDLVKMVTGMGEMLRYLLGEDVEYDLDLDSQTRTVKADPSLLEQIILILAENARDAMPGGGRLAISTRNADPVATRDEAARINPALEKKEYVELSVTDSGKGMDPEVLNHIFEPFFSLKPDGSGVGLSIAHSIVHQSGGFITVETGESAGTTFRVYLPVFRPEEGAEGELPFAVMPRPAGKNATILVVEDESGILYWVRDVLEGMGYRVLSAMDGEEAMTVLEKEGAPVDLLLTDLVMPGVPGNELAERLRLKNPEMKIIFMSGYVDDRIGGLDAIKKKAPFLAKPFTPLSMLMKVKEVLGG